jgi:hypothetical protein
MCIVDDFLLGSKERAGWGELPKVTLFAAIIVFRRHPEITVLVAAGAAPLGSLLKGQSWSTQLTATAQWVFAAVLGAATFRLVGFGDTAHFLAATAALMVVYYALGPVLTARLRAAFTRTDFWSAFVFHRRLAISLQVVGALLALAWRTSWLQPSRSPMARWSPLLGFSSGSSLVAARVESLGGMRQSPPARSWLPALSCYSAK